MSFGRRRRRPDALIDLTPMVDLFLLLILFFALATTFAHQTRLGIDLPEARGQAPAPSANSVEVSVSESGEFAVNGLALVNTDRKTLIAAIRDAARGRKDVPFFLTADARATHQSVVSVLDAAGELGFVNVNIVTREPAR
ncbi:MAG: ExbD/TolR family protein [Gammaproteobacteria bacterium]